MTKSQDLATLFEEMADLIEFSGESPFRANAFRAAARGLRASAEDLERLGKEGRLRDLQGVGVGIQGRIGEFLSTGRIAELDELRRKVPQDLLALSRIPGVGPKTLLMLREALEIGSVAELKSAIAGGRLAGLRGMGPKKIENISKGIAIFEQGEERLPLAEARAIAEAAVAVLREVPGVQRLEVAGSLRRWKETVADIDILCTAERGGAVLEAFTSLPGVTDVLGRGETKASVRAASGRQIDLRVVPEESFGAALQYFTGSKAHNVKLRDLARDRGLKVNEYGVYRGGTYVGGREEADVYAAVGLPWITPELREDAGEIEAALAGRLEEPIALADIRGDLHAHSEWSDGSMSIETLARRAKDLGYGFIVVSDHSRAAHYAGGLTPDRLVEQGRAIASARKAVRGIQILAGSEVDILGDGSLDFPDEILEKLDWVNASIHTGFKQNVTARMIRAMENRYVDAIAHPTGRLLGKRVGYEVDLDAVMAAAARTGTALEINAFPDRLDLSDVHARRARDLGVRITLGTDTHHPGHLEHMEYGVHVARRAGLAPRDVVNCLEAEKILEGRKRQSAAARQAGTKPGTRGSPPRRRATPRRGGSRGRKSSS